MFKGEGPIVTELVVASDSLPAVPDAVIADVAETIRQMHRAHGLSLVVSVGRLIVEKLYGGDTAEIHRRGRKDATLTRLAEQPGLPFSLSQLSRAVGVYESVAQLGPVESWRNLTMTHVRTVLPLPAPQRQALLQKAEAKAWPVTKLEAEAKKARDKAKVAKGAGGRPPNSPTTRAVKTLTRTMEQHAEALDQVNDAEDLKAEEAVALVAAATALKLQCVEIQERMRGRVGGARE